MDSILSELQTRLKSPFFAYFLVSFIAFNWDPLFVLFFDNGLVSYRVEYFREGTDFWSTVVCPFSLAALYMIGYPWLQFGFLKANTKATAMQSNLKIQAEHNAIAEKLRLEAERNQLLKQREEEAIDRAKRDSEAEKITDYEKRNQAKSEIERLRQESDNASQNNINHLSEIESEKQEILKHIANRSGKDYEKNILYSSPLSDLATEIHLEELAEMGILNVSDSINGKYYSMPPKTKRLMVDAGY